MCIGINIHTRLRAICAHMHICSWVLFYLELKNKSGPYSHYLYIRLHVYTYLTSFLESAYCNLFSHIG